MDEYTDTGNGVDASSVNDWGYDPSQATSGDMASNDPSSPVEDGYAPDQAALGQAIVDKAQGDYQAKLGQQIVDQAAGDYQESLGKQIVADAQSANAPSNLFTQFTGSLGSLFRAAESGAALADRVSGPDTVTRPQQILTPSVRGGSTQPRSWLSLFPSRATGNGQTPSAGGALWDTYNNTGQGMKFNESLVAVAPWIVGAVIVGWGIKQFAHK